jgi:tyrosyl-tRNA synthetase
MTEVTVYKEEIPEGEIWVVKLLVLAGLASGKREARQLISRGFISVDGVKITTSECDIVFHDGLVVSRGAMEAVRFTLGAP